MIDALIQLAISNLLLSGAIGLLAYGIHRRGRYPALAHLLWTLALVKAITPPLLTVPLTVGPTSLGAVGAIAGTPSTAGVAGATGTALADAGTWLGDHGAALLLATWLAGSILVLAVSTRRIWRFSRLLERAATPAPAHIQHLADVVAYQLGMKRAPAVYLSPARLSPMTWWTGGRVRVILPSALLGRVDDGQLRWVLAHEVAHIKRRDHYVRWLEWLASVVCWWNPVVWWSRRNLRLDEEDACDALVLSHMQGASRSYARTLLAVVEVMAARGPEAPALATGIDAARSLERRFTRIVSAGSVRQAPRLLVLGAVSITLALMSTGFGVVADAVETVGPATSVRVPTMPPPVVAWPVSGEPSETVSEPAEQFQRVNTAFLTSTPLRSVEFTGSSADDSFVGTNANETIAGHAGADRLGGGRGRDVISGGTGADIIRGGGGADLIDGGAGHDRLGGGAGADIIRGGAGRDTIQGGAGRDTIYAGAGDDVIRVWADGTADRVDCGGGNDRAVVGSSDTTERCETVIIRDPS